MRKLIAAMSLALLWAGCGDEQQQAVDDPSIPAEIPCMACSKPVSKKTEKCPQCGHPAPDSVVAYKKAQEEERKAKPFGGLEVLDQIKKAKENGATELELYKNKISDLSPLAGLTNLKGLDLDFNKITDLSPLKGLTNLKGLSLSFNKITDLSPLKGLTDLTKLNLQANKITDLSPLAGLTNLERLYLLSNQITDLSPLKGLTNLERLNLRYNEISDLSPLKGLTKLEWLYLEGNPIPEEQKAMLKKALPKCKIYFVPE